MEENRITIEPGKRSGQPCIRGLRITVWDVLGWLAAGVDEKTILADYPELEAADFRAIFEYASVQRTDSLPSGSSSPESGALRVGLSRESSPHAMFAALGFGLAASHDSCCR